MLGFGEVTLLEVDMVQDRRVVGVDAFNFRSERLGGFRAFGQSDQIAIARSQFVPGHQQFGAIKVIGFDLRDVVHWQDAPQSRTGHRRMASAERDTSNHFGNSHFG